MPSFFIYNAIHNAQRACHDIISAYELHGRSLIKEVTTYIVITTNFLVGRHKIYAEADEVADLKRRYETQDPVELSQLFSGEYGAQLEKIKHYTEHCDASNNTMGDSDALECKIPSLVRECFDASIVLERNSQAIPVIKVAFMHALSDLVQGVNNSTVCEAHIESVYKLFADIMHNRYPALVKALDCRAHSYVLVNELTQLLVLLQDEQDYEDGATDSIAQRINLFFSYKSHVQNNTTLCKAYPELEIAGHLQTAINERTHYSSKDAVLAMQIMLAMIAQRELSHIIMHQELTLIPERLIYDYFCGTQPRHLLVPQDIQSPDTQPFREELAHMLLMYRLKHMLHLRITYLILRQYQSHLTHILRENTKKPTSRRAHNEYGTLSKQAQILAQLLERSGSIAYAIAEDMLLHMRAKIILHIIEKRVPMTEEDVAAFTCNLLTSECADIRERITQESIQHSLSVKRLIKTIVSALYNDPRARRTLQQDQILENVMHATFANEANSEFTKYLCSRADCFIIGLCNDNEFMEEITTILVAATAIGSIHTAIQDTQYAAHNLAENVRGAESQQCDSDSETDMELETQTHGQDRDGATIMIDPARNAGSRQPYLCNIHDVKQAIRQTISKRVDILKDTDIICRITCQDNVPYTKDFDRQLNILNLANSLLCYKGTHTTLEGIHLPYFAVSGALMLADCALYDHLKSTAWHRVIGAFYSAEGATRSAYKLTVIGMLAAFGIKTAHSMLTKSRGI